MIVLDTQVVSQLQRGSDRDRHRLQQRLDELGDSDLWVTIITPYEQLSDCLGQIKLNRQKIVADLKNFDLLARLLGDYADSWGGKILPFTPACSVIFQGFEAKLVQSIKARDACIAAIGIANQATLITANLRDFQKVPGLKVEGW